MSGARERADKLLVARGFFDSRASARAAIDAGGVSADGVPVSKPCQMLSVEAEIIAVAAHPYVSRGGLKLAHGLGVFGVDPAERSCLDIGASTGGFTDVLLRAGAAHVTAIDVGRGQLHAQLGGDRRVTSHEGLDARALTESHVGPEVSLFVTDLSFIGLEKALGAALGLASIGTELIGLFKPQFQVGRAHIGKGGIVGDEAASRAAMQRFEVWIEKEGWPVLAWTASPVPGGDGNPEHLFYTCKARAGSVNAGSIPRPD